MEKEIVKEALKEWLDEKFSQFGRWTLKSICAILFAIVIYFAASHGLIKS